MQDISSIEQEAAEDIFFGQIVIIWARWFLIFSGSILILWAVDNSRDLALGLVPILALMLINFYLHGRYALEKPANRLLTTLSSMIDLFIVTLIVAIWPGFRGVESPFFVFYYPVILAFAFVFSDRYAIPYTILAMISYAATCLAFDINLIRDSFELEALVLRLVIFAAVGGLGTFYWRIQRDRRRTALRKEPVA